MDGNQLPLLGDEEMQVERQSIKPLPDAFFRAVREHFKYGIGPVLKAIDAYASPLIQRQRAERMLEEYKRTWVDAVDHAEDCSQYDECYSCRPNSNAQN